MFLAYKHTIKLCAAKKRPITAKFLLLIWLESWEGKEKGEITQGTTKLQQCCFLSPLVTSWHLLDYSLSYSSIPLYLSLK